MKLGKGFFKKLISLVVVGTIMASILPANLAFANLQSNIRDLIIRNIPTSDSSYMINFTWSNPTAWSSVSDPNATDGDVYHSPEGYLVEGLNATARESTYFEYDDITVGNTFTDTITPEAGLVSGSIYEFKVTPYHRHTYIQNNAQVKKKAPYDGSNAEKVLFMTDITVTASGAGNTLTVNWDNPQYRGTDIFTGYRIYYQRGGDKVTTFNNYTDVNIKDSNIIKSTDSTRNGVQILTYDIYDANLVQGDYYAVKVEPLYNNRLIRDLSASGFSYATVTIGGNSYKLCFRYLDNREYRTNEANIDIPLEVEENGKDFLKLHWWGISNAIGNIDRIEIYSGDEEDDIGNKLGTIYSSQALYVNTWQIDKPQRKKYYQLQIYVDGKSTPLQSNIAIYDPSKVNITPNIPGLYAAAKTINNTSSIDVFWEAFIRYPYNSNEEAFIRDDGTYHDTNVVYDMWITDALENFNDAGLGIQALTRAPASNFNLTDNDNLSLPCYTTTLTTYAAKNDDNTYSSKNIERNKTYYIKLVASKPCEGEKDKVAEPVYISVYVPTDENISDPQMMSKPPLRIKEENGKKIIDQTSMTIEWNDKWYEIYDDETDNWYSIIALDENKNLVYGIENIDTEKDKLINLYAAENEADAVAILRNAGLSSEEVDSLSIRQVDLSTPDINYEIMVKTYDSINSDGGYLTYLKYLLNSSTGWTRITPTVNKNAYLEYQVSGLDSNTTYVILFRPYRTLTDGTKEAYPTYVIGTTLPYDPDLIITPTVPVLQEVDHTDISFEVRWEEHIPSLDYELAVDEIVVDPNSASIFIDSAEIRNNGSELTQDNKIYMHYNVKNLFPETGYYVWVRSLAHNSSGDVYSNWSNPIYIETDPLSPPQAPDGLGLASKENLKIYNNLNSTNYIPSDYNYLILEWLKVYEDDTSHLTITTPNGDNYEILDTNDYVDNYVVKFNNLIANQRYYARVKTRLIVNQGSDGNSVKTFTYIIQIADNDKFTDAVEVTVPIETDDKSSSSNKYYVAESEWSNVLSFYTQPSDQDYDSDKNPDLYPLPDEDFELIYDYPTRSLTYRFRSDEEDQDGFDDNLVDQRFITRLVSNKVFNYPLDLTSYQGGEIKTRIVEIPFTVMSAFDERKISLELTANNATFTFMPGFLDTAQVESVPNYGYDATVKIIVNEKPADSPALSYNQGYISTPQNVGISITTPTNVVVLDYLAKNTKIAMKLDNRYASVDSNVGAYYTTKQTDVWNRMDFTYDNTKGTYNTESAKLATFAVIANSSPIATGSANSEANSNIANVSSRLNITDLSSFNPQSAVSVVQFNNLIAGIAKGSKDVSLNGALASDDYTALQRKGLLLSGSVVSREQAINSLVKLYETKTGSQMNYYTPLASSPYASQIRTANSTYQTNLLKAADLGFFDTSNGVRPKDVMSLNELFYMTNIILADSNY